jgi:hypothetical protein
MNCRFEYAGPSKNREGFNQYGCVRCPRIAHSPYPVERVIGPNCGGWPLASEWGYWVELFLSAAFISPRGYSRVIAWLGLVEVPESGCGACEARKRWLNTLGGRLFSSTTKAGRFLAWLLVRRATRSQNHSPPLPDEPA